MKTIKQIANELGVSKQAVEKRIARNADIQAYITRNEKGVKQISIEGENLIKAAYASIDTSIDKVIDASIDVGIDTSDNPIDKATSKGIDASIDKGIDTVMDVLTKQLEEKDKQIAELQAHNRDLAETIKIQAQSINADRHNALAGTIQKQITDKQVSADEIQATPQEEKAPGLWKRLFSSRKR